MAARRLLIVMLILLGLSTLAAALVPPRSLRQGTTGPAASTTTTQPTQTAPVVTPPPPGAPLEAKITVGGGKVPVVACPATGPGRKGCSPIHVGDQLSLLVYSRSPAELEIPEFGLVGAASPVAPARFDLLPDAAGTFGILFAPSRKIAARIQVLPPGKKSAKSRARGGSGRA
jgi:hypothetical protein